MTIILNACSAEEMNLGGLRTNPLMVRGGGWNLSREPIDCDQANVLASWLHLAASRKLSYCWIVENLLKYGPHSTFP